MASLSRFYKPQVDFRYTPQVLEMPVEDMYKLAELKEAKMAKGEKDMGDVLGLLDQAKALADIGFKDLRFPIQDRQKMMQDINLLNQEADAIAGKYGNDLSKYGAASEIMGLKRKAVQTLSSGPLFDIGQNVLSIRKFEEAVGKAKEPYQLLGPLVSAYQYSEAGRKKEDITRFVPQEPTEKMDLEGEVLRWQSALGASSVERAGIEEYSLKKGAPKEEMFTMTTTGGVTLDRIKTMLSATLGISPDAVNYEKGVARLKIEDIDPRKMTYTKVGRAIHESALYNTLSTLYSKRSQLPTDDPNYEKLTNTIDGLISGDIEPMGFEFNGEAIYRDEVKGYLDSYLSVAPPLVTTKIGKQIYTGMGGGTKEETTKAFNYKPVTVYEGVQGEEGIENLEIFKDIPSTTNDADVGKTWQSLGVKADELRKSPDPSIRLLANIYDMAMANTGLTKEEVKELDSFKRSSNLMGLYLGGINHYARIALGDKYDALGNDFVKTVKTTVQNEWNNNADQKTKITNDEQYEKFAKSVSEKIRLELQKNGLDINNSRNYLVGMFLKNYDSAREGINDIIFEKINMAGEKYHDFVSSVNAQSLNTFIMPSGVTSKGQQFIDFSNQSLSALDAIKNITGDINKQGVVLALEDNVWKKIDGGVAIPPESFYGITTRPFGKHGIGYRAKHVIDKADGTQEIAEYIVYPKPEIAQSLSTTIYQHLNLMGDQTRGGAGENIERINNSIEFYDQAERVSSTNKNMIESLELWDALPYNKNTLDKTPLTILKMGNYGELINDQIEIWKEEEGGAYRYHIRYPRIHEFMGQSYPGGYEKETGNFDKLISWIINPIRHYPYQATPFEAID